MMKAARVELKLTIGGIPTPIVSADVTSGDGILESAVIVVPTSEYSPHFIRGLKVEVFSRKTYHHIKEDPKWLVEFTGEITGRGYSRSARSSNTSIIAMGHGNAWRRIQEIVYNIIPTLQKSPPEDQLDIC